jgi:hypothetical protein
MRRQSKASLCALAAAAVLAVLVSTASANRLSISNPAIRAVWAPVTVIIPESSLEFVCAMTLEGSFHSSTIQKVAGALVGYITRASVGHPCSGAGEMWVHNGTEAPLGNVRPTSLPWHMTYQGFTGTLPNISEVRLLLRGIRVTSMWRVGEITLCLATFGNAEESIISEWKIGAGGRVIAVQFLAQPLRRRETSVMVSCQPDIRLNSSATTITQLGLITAISVSLI